ncbi:hypothetical protein EHEL_091640 [Encephalitozoon hellem ATCC 50504]|uniref:RING-type domain-containing protein n=1 Tax=Encephalitozoon hellem TaxID=27973 RepID=A0A9Q9C1N3_ENCHE|nr:uncharacterized protein EHEL_091640 [Encephalitozoon hellem ATCC 50504]AFM99058.1 hypothetical protein EHEL_091640 [Encephalitozoon hellem ATCC 50504]UTX42464.1 hypothetical protein GPU96_01g01680 [Encephalitozoon hellem]WEL37909.1 hypothetical protein PFJ87_01g01630 [Encephalitozoon hellem]|eukprot:XP_003888039.1 hypothetical protein EHEL_091640 [Encephalitozoon hellem ATCC 50504]
MKLRSRKIKKRCLIFLVLLSNLLLILFLRHMNRMNITNKVDMGRLKWFGTSTMVVSGLEAFRDVRFSDAISAGELISIDILDHGDAVDSILSRVNTEVREVLLIDARRLRGLNHSTFPRFEREKLNCSLGVDYIEELAKDFIRRVNNGRIKYPQDNSAAKEYVIKLKSFVKKQTKGEDRSEMIRLVNKMFPTIDISFYTYIMMVLLNIREMIVEDFHAIEESFKCNKIYSISNDKINKLGRMIMRTRAFSDRMPKWDVCDVCCKVFTGEGRASLQKLVCNDVICRRCLKQSFLYLSDDLCVKCRERYDTLSDDISQDLFD